ncbi:hypothetical protein WN943_013814 [Citrus x changshan-huyou]
MSRVANDLCEAFPWCKIQYQMLEQLNRPDPTYHNGSQKKRYSATLAVR